MTITDTDRLDFLEKSSLEILNFDSDFFYFTGEPNNLPLRQAIDAAILKERESGNNG
jgi:hypothetical protein